MGLLIKNDSASRYTFSLLSLPLATGGLEFCAKRQPNILSYLRGNLILTLDLMGRRLNSWMVSLGMVECVILRVFEE